MNCGNYRQSGAEQTRVASGVLNDIVLPSFL
jgi:hypothetical protein